MGVTLAGGCTQVLGINGNFRETASGGSTSATSTSVTSSSASTTAMSSSSTGTAANLVADKTMQDFGSVVIGKSDTQTVTFTNVGGNPTGPITTQLGGMNADQYRIMTDNCAGMMLGAGKSCTVDLDFQPTLSGTQTATFQGFATPGGNPPAVALTGVAITPGMLGINPSSTYDFMQIDVGSMSAKQDFVVTNTGGQATGILSTMLTDPGGDFSVTDGCVGQALAGNATCTISVVFKPTMYGAKNLTMVVTGNPPGSVMGSAKGFGMDYFPLSVTKLGNGSGLVTSSNGMIDCGTTCSAPFADMSMVTLTQTPSAGSTFTGWGGACSGVGACVVPMTMAQAVTATYTLQTYTLTVTLNDVGSATGSVTGTGGINCGASCVATFLAGTNVTLNAVPTAGYYLQDWTNGISSTSYSPTFAINGNMTVRATFTPANVIFASTKTYTGNIGGLGAANLECNTEAATAGISGNYVAWLSSSTVDAGSVTHLGGARGWIRPDGKPFGDSEALITGGPSFGHVWYPPRLTAAGADVGPGYWLATGTQSGLKNPGFMCADWTSAAGNAAGGYADAGLQGWSAAFSANCSPMNFHLLCMGTDYTAVTRVVAPPTGRNIFLSSGFFSASSGYAGATNLCTTEATAAGLPGTYKPLLATSGASAQSQFVAHGEPIVRPDGVIVAASDSSFLTLGSSTILAPIEVGANGANIAGPSGGAFTGAASVSTTGTNATTCNNWTSNSGAVTGTSGLTNFSEGLMYFNDTLYAQPGCDNTQMSVYCLQL